MWGVIQILKSKRHFIFLGMIGVIYYSWLLIVLLIAFILGYEGNKAISIPGIVVGCIFFVLLAYTLLYSFFEKSQNKYLLKLPYRTQMEVNKPILIAKWHMFEIYQLKSEFQSYSVLVFSRKKNEYR